jgi:hypothetical protein
MTLTIQTTTGPATVTPRWQGANLAVHTPHRAPGKPPAPRGQWVITHTGSGLSAGTFNGNLRAAVKLARLWDAAFAAVTPEGVRSWPLRDQWCALVRGERPPHPPLQGPVPSANAHPARPMAVQFALDAGRRVRHVAGLWQAFWRGQWWELPADAQLEWWTFDSVAESPDGRTVEPDSPDSWLSILALV